MALSDARQQEILKECRDRLKKAKEDDGENRVTALNDLEFVAVEGKQWPGSVRASRGNRPCLEVNKMPSYIDQVVGDQRMNRPSIKVNPVDSVSDPEVARVLGGWIKHVWRISKADIAIDHAFEHATASSYGAMRVTTKYVSDTSFDQEAFIEKVDNALAVYWGPHQEYDCSDALYCIIVSEIDRDEYKLRYKREPMAFNEAGEGFISGWATKDKIVVAEYFTKEPKQYWLYLLSDGRIVKADQKTEDDVVEDKREVVSYKIMWYLLSGDAVLDSREWVGKKYIPVVPVWGREFNVGGKRVLRSLIRNAKDSQRMYNYWTSVDTEVVALQPKSPYMVTPKQIEGHEKQWNSMDEHPYPYVLCNFDEKAPGWPHREAPPQASSAMTQKIIQADQEMRDTIGLQKASLGMQSNERSGAAIRERKQEGDVGTFAFHDNLARSIEQLGRILVDMAPGLLDTERIVRLGLDDGKQEFVTVNKKQKNPETGVESTLLDLSVGTYDVAVTVGPSFTTQRTEARQSMGEFLQYFPGAATVIGDLYAKVNDWPEADKIAKRLYYLLPPEIKKAEEAEAIKRGEVVTPPATESEQPPLPPEMQLKLKEGELKLQEADIKIEEAKVKLEQEKLKLKEIEARIQLMEARSKEKVKELVDQIVEEAVTGGQDAGKIEGSTGSNSNSST